ncbi:hypothetical protein LAZ67_20001172 [Cordylochernes scorpioides]|uniref:RNA-directed DNA polymerase n=1 Tax=Cordylochernes scorpioides TaxID=51811 RepID=A0ABY6LJQ9_9ARAC|nr:hypothetical protein LAZ67_20001172 [Cordylochernes scorpioides]
MTYLAKVRKCDLSKLAYELGEVVPPESRIVDLKRLILNSQSYEEEFAKQLLETLIEEREQTAQTEQAERIERERKEQMVMEFELEKLRIQTTRGNNDTSRSTSNDAHYEIRKLMPKYESKDNDLSFYLILFERQAKRLGLDEDQWAFSLLGLLPYEMTQLIARETEEQSGDYRFVKRLLLKRYKLSPEQFRQKFEKHERSQKGSWRDFAFELRGYFNEWIEGMNVENFDALKDLSVTNQLKKKVPNVLRNHLIDDWTKLNNPDELADKLDEYENVRTEMGPPHWNAKHLIPPSFQQKSARFPNQSEVKETKQGTNVSGQDAARNEISETYPNTLRRMVNRTIRNDKGEPKCFNCNQFGHIARDCPAPRTTLTCRGCGQTGHKERNCTRPKEGLKVANLEVEGLETVPPDVYLKDVKIDNKETVKAMIDTGSSSCLMRESVARRISVDIEPDSTSLYGIGNQTAPAARTVGKTTVDLEIDGIVGREITVFIVNDDAQPYDLLIGRTWTDLPYVSFARIGKNLHIGYSSEFPFTNLQEEIKSRRIELRATETVQLESDSINFTSAITDEVKDGYVLFTGVDDACVDSLLEVVDGKTTVPIISAGKGKLRVRKNQCVGRVELLNLDDIVVNLDVAEDSFQTKNEEKREGQDQMKRKRPILPEDINVNHSLTSKERQEILDVVNEYRDCFALGMEELGCTDVTKMDIKEVDGSKPVCLRPYKTTASEREAIREIVREWKDNGIVTETRSPYASPVLLVRKKTGDHRLVVDYRRLNIQTVKDKFPLPRIDNLLEGLRNAKFFTTLDLAHGYLQIPLTDKAKLKTAFITPDDTGQFERMIFGLANAPAEFQRLMHTVLGPLLNKKAFCYLDDVIIPAKDWREMIERLREVLERIRSAKLTLKPSKCEFGRREVEFLGYVISTGGLKPGPRKIKAIEEFPEPKNVHDIRRFLGLTNFFRRFVKDFARKAEPLSRLTKKGSQFEWKEEQRRSFGGLRKDLVEYPVLAHYNPELKTEVHCDASAEGLAGMVLQMDEDCKWRLVYCVSKKTTEAEKMYHSSKLELMAIVWTLDRLRQFLVGIKFTVVTDCQALVYMNAKKTTNPQIARWYNLIQEYDFEIRHKPGEKMAHVDGMSRAPVDDPRDTMEEIVEKNLEVCLTITPEEQILMIQHSDPELRDLIQIFRKDPCDRTVGQQNRINDYSYRRKSGRGARSRRYPPTQPTTYYPALKTLEQLEHTYLPRVSRYKFALSMHATIPQLRNRIKEASMSELRDFLESIRKVSAHVGKVAMKHVSEQLNVEASLLRRKRIKRLDSEMSNLEVDLSTEECSAQELVDFSPVYRCLHIYSVLGIREEFENYYRHQRLQQARLASQAPLNMHESVENYEKYFCVIVGFLVVEGHILNTANGLVSRAYLDDIWESIVTNIVASLRSSMCQATGDSDLILKVKRLILLLTATLRSYGYPVGPLFDLLLEVKDTYLAILFQQWGQLFSSIFQQDPFHPMHVETQEEYAFITDNFPFSDPDLEKAPFPKKMPFSQFVPKVFVEVKEFIFACLRFAEELNLSQAEMEDMVRKSTSQLLTKTLGDALSALIKKPNLGLFQINLNMNYLEDSSGHLENLIAEHIGNATSDGSRFQSQSMFKEARADAEQQIFQQLNKKIDDFFSLANYNWTMGEPSGQASSYLRDLLAFLRSTFESFSTLPMKVGQTACVSACQHLARCLLRLVLDESTSRQISFGALQQLSLDVLQCEMFASSELSAYGQDLALCFAQLRQLLDLFIHWDWANFFKDYGLEVSRYPRVDPQAAIILLEK